MDRQRKAIFFDVDDTLYDHLIPFRKAAEQTAGEDESFPYEAAYRRLRYYSDTLSEELGGAGSMESGDSLAFMRRERFRRTFAEFGVALTDDEAEAMQAAYNGCQYDIAMFPGARELLAALVAEGHLVGLITNGAASHQQRKIDAMMLDGLIRPEHRFISGAVGWDKPDKRLFRHVNERTGTLPEHCVYIGDSWRNDVVGALGAGWTAVWFNHRGARPESGHRPHHTAASYAELKELLLRLHILIET
jgi:putative hydrolase of the HAD superfamily